ncbi:MAG: hypothetical protein ACN0LA_03675 [Candidatus Longimicrobiales bacterium M2_2A_002]
METSTEQKPPETLGETASAIGPALVVDDQPAVAVAVFSAVPAAARAAR